ncbi:long-chain-fatty-acid--CoA ligase [Gordonia sp. i37]|uniref:long-chain-fatty-acid--CoA ligase n=1 Tax=Gordonia sp. i37 TaxID=1961707 RepID=UPI0009ADDA1F|nr:long-chain-fatty-acid--CoA ligase [Gordonia sp. i37]OPX16586.1 hypothetical protein B1964_04005 [Gordonia sp. i37]
MSGLAASRSDTWSTQIARHAHNRPDHVAIRFRGTTLTWRELDEHVQNLAGWLVRRQIGKGDRVGLVMGNRPEFLEVVYACARVGAIVVPINFRLTAPEIEYILTDSGASLVVTESAFLEPVRAAASARPTEILGVTDDSPDEYRMIVKKPCAPVEFADVAVTDPAAIMYTSGTTGHPKGAVLTHENFAATADVIIDAWRLDATSDTVLAATPLFHIGGFGTTTGPARLGLPLVIHPSTTFDPSELLDVIQSEKVTATFMVPAQWQAICMVPDAGERGRSLRAVGWGAAPAPLWLLERLGELFPEASVVAIFGQTEMSPVTCVLHGDEAVTKRGSVGRPVFTVSVRVVDEDMNDVGADEIGEIVYRGKGLMHGYWNKPEATEEAFAGGWFHSGDMVRRDADGYIYVVDRKKDMIISGGENIYSAEVEMALSSHPAVRDVAVIGRRDDRLGEAVVAVIEPMDITDPPSLESLVAHCRDRLASYKKPRDLVVVGQLPRNATGKIIKGELRTSIPIPTT